MNQPEPEVTKTTILKGRMMSGREIRRVTGQTEVNFVCAGREETRLIGSCLKLWLHETRAAWTTVGQYTPDHSFKTTSDSRSIIHNHKIDNIDNVLRASPVWYKTYITHADFIEPIMQAHLFVANLCTWWARVARFSREDTDAGLLQYRRVFEIGQTRTCKELRNLAA